jgi:hypothetical protein
VDVADHNCAPSHAASPPISRCVNSAARIA